MLEQPKLSSNADPIPATKVNTISSLNSLLAKVTVVNTAEMTIFDVGRAMHAYEPAYLWKSTFPTRTTDVLPLAPSLRKLMSSSVPNIPYGVLEYPDTRTSTWLCFKC